MASRIDNDLPKIVTGYPAVVVTGYPQEQFSNTATVSNTYPYVAPPPVTYYRAQPRRITLLSRLIIVMISLIIIFILAGFIMWLILRPKFTEFQVDSLTTTPLILTNSKFNATWDVSLTVKNPNNKMSIFYDRLETYLIYRENDLAATLLEPFFLEKENQTRIHAKLNVYSDYVMEEWLAKDMADDKSRGEVSFSVRMRVYFRFKAGVWVTMTRSMIVYCEKLRVKFLGANEPGELMGGSKECFTE